MLEKLIDVSFLCGLNPDRIRVPSGWRCVFQLCYLDRLTVIYILSDTFLYCLGMGAMKLIEKGRRRGTREL